MSTIINYPAYFQTLKNNPPKSDHDGLVQKQVDHFKKDAFKDKPVASSYEDDHGIDQCKRVDNAKKFWTKRCADAQKSA